MKREEAREILTHNWTRVDNPNYSESELDEAFFMAIEALQTLEAVERIKTEVLPQTDLVRCKDCMYCWYDDDTDSLECRHNKGLNEEIYGNDFCCYGERREE